MCSVKCLKSPVSEHPSRVNKLKGPKLFLNLHNSTFISFFHNLEENCVGK